MVFLFVFSSSILQSWAETVGCCHLLDEVGRWAATSCRLVPQCDSSWNQWEAGNTSFTDVLLTVPYLQLQLSGQMCSLRLPVEPNLSGQGRVVITVEREKASHVCLDSSATAVLPKQTPARQDQQVQPCLHTWTHLHEQVYSKERILHLIWHFHFLNVVTEVLKKCIFLSTWGAMWNQQNAETKRDKTMTVGDIYTESSSPTKLQVVLFY